MTANEVAAELHKLGVRDARVLLGKQLQTLKKERCAAGTAKCQHVARRLLEVLQPTPGDRGAREALRKAANRLSQRARYVNWEALPGE